MSFPLAEVLRITATVAGTAVGGPLGGISAGALTGLANELDKEDDEETPASIRKMKRERRKRWIEHAVDLEKEKRKHMKHVGENVSEALRRALNNRAAADIRAIIAADIHETEERTPGEQEINLYAEAVAATARRKL